MEGKWVWLETLASADPDFQAGQWHALGPEGNARMQRFWETPGEIGDTVKLTVAPLVTLTWTLVCVLAQGMVFKRNSTPGLVYLVKQAAPFLYYNVGFISQRRCDVTSLSGDVLATLDVFPHMLWGDIRDMFADMIQAQSSKIRLVSGLRFIGQRNMKRPIQAVVISEDVYTPVPSNDAVAKAKAKATPRPKAQAAPKPKAKAKAKGQARRPAAVQRRPAALRRPAAAA